jgi:pyridoxamine 5'-phosphate oxidase
MSITHTQPSTDIAHLRKSYEKAELSEEASHADPIRQFDQWLNQAMAAQVPEPNAMTLATVSSTLRPSTRVVLIKGYDEHGIVWYTNYDSRKGQDLAGNPWAALQFHWVELERTVRIEGRVEKVSEAQSDAYSRPFGAGHSRSQVRRSIFAAATPPTPLGGLPSQARPVAILARQTQPLA